jgi:hypothetical protein
MSFFQTKNKIIFHRHHKFIIISEDVEEQTVCVRDRQGMQLVVEPMNYQQEEIKKRCRINGACTAIGTGKEESNS